MPQRLIGGSRSALVGYGGVGLIPRATGGIPQVQAQAALASRLTFAEILSGFANLGGDYYDMIMAETGLRGYWRLDETSGLFALDSRPDGNTGTYANMAALGGAPVLVNDPDPAATFSFGTSNVAVNGVFDFAAGPVSIELWIQRSTITLDKGLFSRPGAGATHWGMNIIGGTGQVHFFGGSTPGAVVGTPNLNDTNLHHLVGVNDGTAAGWFMYVDGVDVSSAIVSATPTSNTGVINWGQDLASDFFVGQMGQCAVYNVALAPDRVLAHYNLGAAIAAAGYPFIGGGYYDVA